MHITFWFHIFSLFLWSDQAKSASKRGDNVVVIILIVWKYYCILLQRYKFCQNRSFHWPNNFWLFWLTVVFRMIIHPTSAVLHVVHQQRATFCKWSHAVLLTWCTTYHFLCLQPLSTLLCDLQPSWSLFIWLYLDINISNL